MEAIPVRGFHVIHYTEDAMRSEKSYVLNGMEGLEDGILHVLVGWKKQV
jgi:hypothetical protein